MKHTLQTLAIILLIFIAFSCDKNDSTDGNQEQITTANYYVKYEANCSYPQVMRSVTVQTNTGSTTVDLPAARSWTETYGPVSKGFKANINIGGSANAIAKIYVSKNQEPFSLKASDGVNASYTIDF